MTTELLVIDDSATMRKLVEIAFRGGDCAIAFAGTGGEGLAQAFASPPAAVLVDFMLPDMKGLDVCARLAAHPGTAAVGVVVMSGKPEIASLVRDLPNVVGFLGKPFSPEVVRATINDALARRGHQAPAARTRRSSRNPEEPAAPLPGGGEALALHGRLETTALYEVLRLLTASRLAGVLRLDSGEHLYLAEGDVVLCATTRATDELDRLALRGGADLDAALAAARITQRQTGKPALVTLAEAGFAVEVDLAAALKAQGHRLLTAALSCRAGRFWWQQQALPEYVAKLGRPLSFSSIALEVARARPKPAPSPPELYDHVYQRAAGFSGSLAGLRLTSAERSVLAALDGAAPVRAVAERTKLAPQQVASTISHLTSIELIMRADGDAAAATSAPPPIVVHALEAELVEQLRALLGRRPVAVPVVDSPTVAELEATVARTRPQLVLVGLAPRRPPPDPKALARTSTATLVAVLEMADDTSIGSTLELGYDAVLLRPIHITELERLLAL